MSCLAVFMQKAACSFRGGGGESPKGCCARLVCKWSDQDSWNKEPVNIQAKELKKNPRTPQTELVLPSIHASYDYRPI